MTMTLIETKTLGADAASIEFTSIPQDGTDLVVLVSARSTRAGETNDPLQISFNSSSANQSSRTLRGSGSAASSFSTAPAYLAQVPAATATADTFGNVQIYIPNYTSTIAKSFSSDGVGENNATAAFQLITAGLWNPSPNVAITSLAISMENGNLTTGSTVSLYKVTSGTDGIVTTS